MPIESKAKGSLMCLTQDGLALGHVEQARQLCAAGAKWIQLRMKTAAKDEWLETAQEVVRICRLHGAVCIVNDSVEIALAAGADGVHLGKLDLDWTVARERIGPDRIVGGTVNNLADARRAKDARCLDYVGVGPLRFTANKKNLAPVLGMEGVAELVRALRPLPAWVIGGVAADDLCAIRGSGAAGAAVSSALFSPGRIEENFYRLWAAWSSLSEAPRPLETVSK